MRDGAASCGDNRRSHAGKGLRHDSTDAARGARHQAHFALQHARDRSDSGTDRHSGLIGGEYTLAAGTLTSSRSG